MNKKILMLGMMAFTCLCGLSAQEVRNFAPQEKTVYQLHQSIIDDAAYRNAEEQMVEMILTYKVPNEKRKTIYGYLVNKEKRKACYDYLLPDSLRPRVRKKMEIDSIYRDSVNIELIPIFRNKISGYNISFALFMSPSLQLDDAQHSFLMNKALDMARRMRADRDLSVWDEEMYLLKTTLTKKQLDSFFRNKNARIVTKLMKNGWKKLEDAGFTEELDSAKDMGQAYYYWHEQQKIKDLYKFHSKEQRKYLATLKKNMPAMVKLLDGLDKQKRKEEEQKEGNISKDFVW